MVVRRFIAALLIFITVACGGRRVAPQSSNELIIARLSEPTSLNPLYLQGSDASDIGALAYSALTKYNAHGAIVADAATVVPTVANGGISRDGRRIVYHLRRDVKWQDGYPLTARDIVFTYGAAVSPSNALPTEGGYNPIARVSARDSYTVVVELKRPYAPIITNFFGGDGNPILPAHLLAAYSSLNHAAFNGAPVGSGPYRFVRWLRGDRLDLTANERYYGTKPAIRYISIRFVHDHSTTVNQLITHEVDATFFASPSRIEAIRSIPDHRVIVTRTLPSFGVIAFNMHDPIVENLVVRQAFALALDRHTLVAKGTFGVYDADTGMRGMFTWAFDPTARSIPYDPTRARTLLTERGWIPGNDGIRVKNGQRLRVQLAFWGQSFVATEIVPLMIEEARSVGLDLVPKAYGQSELYSLDGPLYRGKFQAALLGLQQSVDPDPSAYVSCDQRPPNGFNFARYCSRDVDHALRCAVSVYDRADRRRIYSFIQRRLIEAIPYDFLWQASEVDVIPAALHGYEPSAGRGPYNSVADWRL